MRVHRQIARRVGAAPPYLMKLPAIQWYSFAAGEVFNNLAPIAAGKFGAAFAGGTDLGNGETRVICHGDDGGLAIARMALDPDLFGIHGRVGFKIIQRAARAPCPGAQRAPIVRFARLAFVAQTDNALASGPRRCRPGNLVGTMTA